MSNQNRLESGVTYLGVLTVFATVAEDGTITNLPQFMHGHVHVTVSEGSPTGESVSDQPMPDMSGMVVKLWWVDKDSSNPIMVWKEGNE